jgi:hypothetical protein
MTQAQCEDLIRQVLPPDAGEKSAARRRGAETAPAKKPVRRAKKPADAVRPGRIR